MSSENFSKLEVYNFNFSVPEKVKVTDVLGGESLVVVGMFLAGKGSFSLKGGSSSEVSFTLTEGIPVVLPPSDPMLNGPGWFFVEGGEEVEFSVELSGSGAIASGVILYRTYPSYLRW